MMHQKLIPLSCCPRLTVTQNIQFFITTDQFSNNNTLFLHQNPLILTPYLPQTKLPPQTYPKVSRRVHGFSLTLELIVATPRPPRVTLGIFGWGCAAGTLIP